ncbi:MAG: hypothetical protein ACLR7U_06430, partial [Ruthenibacterium lactatiformans]
FFPPVLLDVEGGVPPGTSSALPFHAFMVAESPSCCKLTIFPICITSVYFSPFVLCTLTKPYLSFTYIFLDGTGFGLTNLPISASRWEKGAKKNQFLLRHGFMIE